MSSVSAWSSESTAVTLNEEWKTLSAGTYTFAIPILVTEKVFGRKVLTGAMATETENQELQSIVKAFPDQIAEIKADFQARGEANKAEILAAVKDEINTASRKSYWKGFKDGSIVGFLVGGGLFCVATNN